MLARHSLRPHGAGGPAPGAVLAHSCFDGGMSASGDYRFATRTNGEVVIFHHGKLAKMLREKPAQDFLDAIKDLPPGEDQAVMAAAVGHDDQMPRPTSGTGPTGKSLHGDGMSHAHKEFRRKSGG